MWAEWLSAIVLSPRPSATPNLSLHFGFCIGPKLGSFWQKRIFRPYRSAIRFLAALRRLVSAQRSYRSNDANPLRSFVLTGKSSIKSVLSYCCARIAWICASSGWAQAKCCAASCCSSVAGALINAPTLVMIFSTVNESGCLGRDRPCLKALRLEFCFPAAVLGPLLRLALARLAAICFSDANVPSSWLLDPPPNSSSARQLITIL
jgi:hypothetical protein